MARLPYVEPDDPSADPRAVRMLVGVDVNLYKAMANHPDLLEGFAALAGAVYAPRSLTPKHRELAYLTATAANRCHY